MELERQIRRTIAALERKLDACDDFAVADILHKYKRALDQLKARSELPAEQGAVRHLLNCARGYLETSSDWDQEFLDEMGKTEQLVKRL